MIARLLAVFRRGRDRVLSFAMPVGYWLWTAFYVGILVGAAAVLCGVAWSRQ